MPKPEHEMENLLEKFIEEERRNGKKLETYLTDARSNYQTLTVDQRKELGPDAAKFLYANNCEAHIAVARAASAVAVTIDQLIDNSHPGYWVTLATNRHVTTLEDAPHFDIRRLQAFGRQMLRGYNFLGIVEPAFYGNYRLSPADNGRGTISWHIHAIVWDVNRREIYERKNEINIRYETLIPGPTAAHVETIRGKDVYFKLLYMLKGQRDEYRIYPKKGEFADHETGEILIDYTGRYKQRTQPLRPGDRVRMCRVLENRCIDRMLFAGGTEGKEILNDFKRVILQPYNRFEREHNVRAGPVRQRA